MDQFVDLKLDSWLVNQLKNIGKLTLNSFKQIQQHLDLSKFSKEMTFKPRKKQSNTLKLSRKSIKKPTEVQKNCLPEILNGKNCLGCSKTGSGKTLTFALPILNNWARDPCGVFAIILTPTRELAYQIADQFSILGKPMSFRYSVIIGGIDMVNQGKELSKRPHIIIATPGRLADHFSKVYIHNEVPLRCLKFLVFDEADRLFNGQFDSQLETIMGQLPAKKQMLYFTATVSDRLREVVHENITRDMYIYEKIESIATVSSLEQYYVLCGVDYKEAYLVEIIEHFRKKTKLPKSIIIFANTCKNCQMLSMLLNRLGVRNVMLHSLVPQRARMSSLHAFRDSRIRVLVTTNVASRGLDIPSVSLVINYQVPLDPDEYIHRVGRTARKQGQVGFAITLIVPRVNSDKKSKKMRLKSDINRLKNIESRIGMQLQEYDVNDRNVAKIIKKVYTTKSAVDINLNHNEFFQKRQSMRHLN